MATRLNEPVIKQLTETGAVTTNNKGGILRYLFVCGSTAADKVEVLDGATVRLTVLVPANNGSVEVTFPEDHLPVFYTDIDCTITKSGSVYATFIYEEKMD